MLTAGDVEAIAEATARIRFDLDRARRALEVPTRRPNGKRRR
jgi:hypothetical protein